MITCPNCGQHLLVFLDMPGDKYAVPEQPEPSSLLHRFQVCCTCKTHTHQTLVEIPGQPGWGKWTCNKCGHTAMKRHAMPLKES